ncbi:MAG: zinc finger HIT domain-containing protein [Halanaeroarchaeum sp.]
MSVQGLCQVCESAPAKYACERCGALVCADHYDADVGLCTSCAAASRRDSGDSDRLR